MLSPLGALKSLWHGLTSWVPNDVFAAATECGSGGNGGGDFRTRKPELVEPVYTCGKILGETMGSFPLHFYKGKGSEREQVHDHWCGKLFKAPGLNLTQQELIERAMHGCVINGRGPMHIVRNGNGDPVQIVPLKPECLHDEVLIIDGKYERVYTYNKEFVPTENLWLPSNIWGLSPISVLRKQLGMVQGYEEYATATMRNGAKPSGVLSNEGKLDPEAKDKLRKAWRSKYQGVGNTANVIILESGMTWTPTPISNEDLQFIEQYEFTRRMFFAVYRVPPHMAGDLANATFSNIEHQGLEFKQYTMLPWATRIEQSINRDFLSNEEGVYCKFNMDALERGDFKTRTEGQVLQVTNGIKTPDEIRSLNEDQPYAGGIGSKPMMPLNMSILGEQPTDDNMAGETIDDTEE